MRNYVKAIFYAYPFLNTMDKEYDEHLKNRAVLSYRTDFSAERIALYIASEIVEKQTLQWVKQTVESVLETLDCSERTFVQIRYFGKRRKIRRERLPGGVGALSERSYFRKQSKLVDKLGAMLTQKGLDKQFFNQNLMPIELFAKAYQYVCKGRDLHVRKNEREWIAFREF